MRSRLSAICLLLCVAMLVTSTLGVHMHAMHEHPAGATEHSLVADDHGHTHGGISVVMEHVDDHVLLHLNGTAVDIDQASSAAPAKVSSLSLLLGLVAAILVLSIPRTADVPRFHVFRVPIPRLRYRALPPSQGPPAASAFA